MLDPIEVLKEARELGSVKTLADVDAALAGYDYPTMRATEKEGYRVELWDGTSAVNGIVPEVIGKDVPKGGKVYLIYINDKLVFLQKHDPEQAGFVAMTTQNARAIAGNVVDNMVEQIIDGRVKQEVLRALL